MGPAHEVCWQSKEYRMRNLYVSRRRMLEMSCLGFGTMALELVARRHRPNGTKPYNDLRPRQGHFPAQAKAIIQLVQNGGPSQMELFDPKAGIDQTRRTAASRRRRNLSAQQRKSSPGARPLSFGNTDNAGWNSPNCFRTPPPPWTICASSVRCTRRITITWKA